MKTDNIGLNRNIIDKFYTKKNIVKYCINLIKKYIKINKKKDLIIEPSAGNGSFILFIKQLCNNYMFFDIKPDNNKIIKQDFLKFNYKCLFNKYNKIHIIGNPPFGRQSSLTIKFIKKSCEFSDTLSFILPKSFKKVSLKNKIPLNFHLLVQKDLPLNSFTINNIEHNVPCIFQIWIKKSYNRKEEIKQKSKYFIFVKKNNNPNIAIKRIGVNAGKVIYDNVNTKNKNSHYFLKINNNKNKIIELLLKHKYNIFNNTVGPKSISKQELITFYNKFNL